MYRYNKIFVILLLIIQENFGQNFTKSDFKELVRKKRFLPVIPPPPPLVPSILYGYNAATGILVAIAIPVPLPDQNVFVSYNFEANFNMANQPSDAFPGPLVRLKLTDKYPAVDPNADAYYSDVIARNMEHDSDDFDDEPETTTIMYEEEEQKILEKRDLSDTMKVIFTRVGIYHMLENRLEANGVDGKKCLLHAICETARTPIIENNGILGHILHIILTPSSSKIENLPSEYYKAELRGLDGNCRKYEKVCNLHLLDLISTIV
ncbi:hypothetical protein PVAND_000892 [Polypedilum vanderplanki]|uniref:Uncharacterized protein n=1 Tax=Polypedilum vanderplanki TaxID=319348 RepID=A0A9J6BLA7_POLVA|nr:hypothetical protein PVAND_000892 [Polypedilum vanderplanki]